MKQLRVNLRWVFLCLTSVHNKSLCFLFVTLMFLNASFANSMGNMRVLFVTNRFSPDQVEAQIKYTCMVQRRVLAQCSQWEKWNRKLSIQVKFKEIAGNKPTICICFHGTVGFFLTCVNYFLTVHLFCSGFCIFLSQDIFFRQAIQPNEWDWFISLLLP